MRERLTKIVVDETNVPNFYSKWTSNDILRRGIKGSRARSIR